MNATIARKSNALAAVLARATILAAQATDLILTVANRPRPGRPVRRDPQEMLSQVSFIAEVERLFAADPLAGYVAAARMRRELSADERAKVKESDEARFQGVLPCGDPAQATLFVMTHIRVTGDDWNGEAFRREARRALAMARAACQDEAKTRRQDAEENGTEYVSPVLYLRYQRNFLTRLVRNAGVGTNWRSALRALFGGRLYFSDAPDHGGSLLAIVTPNEGDRTALASYEWQVPGFN